MFELYQTFANSHPLSDVRLPLEGVNLTSGVYRKRTVNAPMEPARAANMSAVDGSACGAQPEAIIDTITTGLTSRKTAIAASDTDIH